MAFEIFIFLLPIGDKFGEYIRNVEYFLSASHNQIIRSDFLDLVPIMYANFRKMNIGEKKKKPRGADGGANDALLPTVASVVRAAVASASAHPVAPAANEAEEKMRLLNLVVNDVLGVSAETVVQDIARLRAEMPSTSQDDFTDICLAGVQTAKAKLDLVWFLKIFKKVIFKKVIFTVGICNTDY